MKQKSVLTLSIVTLAALGAAGLALRSQGGADTSTARSTLFPQLPDRINELAKLRVEKAGKSVMLAHEGGQWKLADRGGYPAQFEKVKELAMQIAGLEIEEAKTSRKENHAKLALEWPPSVAEGEDKDTSAGEAALVTLMDASGKELASVVLGKSEWRGSKPKVFVRRAGEDQVYLCGLSESLEADPEVKHWVDPKFVELASDRVQSVTIEHADGERVEIGRSAANHTKFSVQNLPLGAAERYDGVASGVAQALTGMQLDDVRPASEVDFTKEPVAKTRYRCIDGLELLVETAKADDKTWLKIAASYTPPPEAAAAVEGEKKDPDVGDTTPAATEGADKKDDKKDVAKEASDLNERLAPWAFAVPSYKTDQIVRRMKDLLAEPKPAGAADGAMGDMEPGNEAASAEDEEGVEPTTPSDDEGKPAPKDEKPDDTQPR